MPNPGGPFLGCETCRRRKIKCDRAKPACVRCQKYGKPCPGYPRLQDASFRNETKRVAQKNNTSGRWGYSAAHTQPRLIAKAKPATLALSCSKQSISITKLRCSGFEDSNLLGSLHKPKVAAWDDVLSELFFAQNVMPVGWFAFLPQLYYQSLPNAGITQAVLAASYFLAANQLKDPGMLAAAQYKYGLALRLVSSALADERAMDDETLASILVLNIVDDIAGQSNTSLHAHLNGCAELVRLRTRAAAKTQRSTDLVHSVIIQMQPSLMLGLRLAATSLNDTCTSEWLWPETEPPPSVTVSALSARIGQFSKKANDSCSRKSTDCDSLLKEGISLDELMLEWRGQQKERWEVRTTTDTDMDAGMHYYSDVQVAKVWNHWRAARIILHSALLTTIEQQPPSERATKLRWVQAESLAVAQQMISEICASIPYHIHQIDEKGRQSSQIEQRVLGGRALMWPLKMVLSCKWSSASQRREAVEALHLIGDDFGIKQAAVFLREALELSRCQQPINIGCSHL